MTEIELDGMDEVLKKLEDLGKKANLIKYDALSKAGEVILNQAKNNLDEKTKRRTGNLKDSLSVSTLKGSGENRYVLVGIQKDDNSEIYYGKFIEWGASAHIIRIKRGRYKGRVINHPGVNAKPFLGPAYISKKDEAKNILKNEIKKSLGL